MASRPGASSAGLSIPEALARVAAGSLIVLIELGAITRTMGAPGLDDWLVTELAHEMARRLGTPAPLRDPTRAIPDEQLGYALYAAGVLAAIVVRCHGHRLPDVDNVINLFEAVRDALLRGRPACTVLH